MAQLRIRSMGHQRKTQIEARIGVKIIVNASVDQPLREYTCSSSTQRAIQLKERDIDSELEFCSYPWYDGNDKEWKSVGQFNDEKHLLYLNPFIIMNQFAFYGNAIIALCGDNSIARRFVHAYLDDIDIERETTRCV